MTERRRAYNPELGDGIPRLYGYYEMWGILHLALVGEAFQVLGHITIRGLRQRMNSRIHIFRVDVYDPEICRLNNDVAKVKAEIDLIESLQTLLGSLAN